MYLFLCRVKLIDCTLVFFLKKNIKVKVFVNCFMIREIEGYFFISKIVSFFMISEIVSLLFCKRLVYNGKVMKIMSFC